MRRAALLLAFGCALLTACGGSDQGGAGPVPEARLSDRLVDFSKDPPYVNALDIDPADGVFLLTTNRGFWRIDADSGEVEQVRGRITAQGKSATVGTFLELLATGPGTLIGSGHPDEEGSLPAFLGFIESRDGGRSWSVIARLGDADLHKIVSKHDRLYAFDAVLGALLVSTDGGRSFTEHFTPRGLIIDFEVDPADPDKIVASTEKQLFVSTDGGDRWRGLDQGDGIRLAWPAARALYRAEVDGTVGLSVDGGASWEDVGKVPGEPYKFKPLDAERLYLALSDGTIMGTRDGGRTWTEAFRP
ncbi:MAG TPA: hypothetical protein VEY49_05560 [Solirubrobacteraceae bacterium]|nr:hypothetical protein [Solirubrobacteraceae bacterium]